MTDLKKNFIMNAMLTVSSILFPIITFPYVSRVLGPEGTGRVSFATSLVSYFTMFAQLGIPTYGIRACAAVRDDREALTRTAHELLMINLVMSAVSYAAFFACLFTLPQLREERTLCLVVSAQILLTSIGMEWLYKALEQYTYITIRSLLFKLIALGAMFLLVRQEGDYLVYGAISIFAGAASNLLNLIHVRRLIGIRSVGGYRPLRHIRAVGVFFAMSCATVVYTHLDTVMLGFMTNTTEVGYYNAAVRIKTILVSFVTSLGAVLLPRLSYYVERGEEEAFRRITEKALTFVFLLAAPLMVYFMIFAREGIYFLSGGKYAPSILPMQLIMPTLLFIGMSNITGIQILVPLGRERVVLRSEMAGAAVDLAINAALIPFFASAGAAAGTLIAEFVVLLYQIVSLRERIGGMLRRLPAGLTLAALAAGGAASFWVKWLSLRSFPALVLSSVLFFGAYLLVLLLCREPVTAELAAQAAGRLKKRPPKAGG